MVSPKIPCKMIFPKDIKVLSLGKGEQWTPYRPRVRVELKILEEEGGESSKVNREVIFTNEEEVTCPTYQHSFKYTPRKRSRSSRHVERDWREYPNWSRPKIRVKHSVNNRSWSHSPKKLKLKNEQSNTQRDQGHSPNLPNAKTFKPRATEDWQKHKPKNEVFKRVWYPDKDGRINMTKI